jgi:O-antigen/teichoic acid export membrane protein
MRKSGGFARTRELRGERPRRGRTPHDFDARKAVRSTASTRGFLGVLRWSFAMESGRQLVSLAVSFVIAAVLGPKAYGLVAMAMTYVLFVELIQQQGLSAALVQRKDLTQRHADTAFWMVVGSSGVLTIVSVVLSGWWASANRLPELQPVIMALSALVPIHALVVVQEALLRRQMRFRALAIRTFLALVAGAVSGLAGAFLGWGVWALVAQQLTQAVVALVALWGVSGWRPRFAFSAGCAGELFGFSSGSFLSGLAVFVNKRADALLIGLFFGPIVVGLYRFAMRLVEFLVQATSRSFQSIALSELAPFQSDLPQLQHRLRRMLELSVGVALPALGVLAGCAAPVVALLGDQWLAAVDVLRVLAIVGVVWAVTLLDGIVLQALGRPHIQAVISWLAAAVSAASFVVAALVVRGLPMAEQALGVAVARALVYGSLIVAIHLVVLRRFVGLPVTTVLRMHVAPITAAVTAALTGGMVDVQIASLGSGAVVRLAVSATTAVLAAALALLLLDDRARRLVRQAPSRVRRGAHPEPAPQPVPDVHGGDLTTV